ncbi:hypothetical protein J437_LFUL010049 [Ladona fulva]|uniref:PiggyBac transposable element-derived protein domain-containing protein n=1 Tax=Ladona fulva TaxID=123851 RepID=A0A8K0NYN2_LADFU|nr:hypothetical protein J437_LFUL010049 [Ladona fulva]
MDRKRKLLEEDIEQELLADSDSDAYNSDVSDDSDEGDSVSGEDSAANEAKEWVTKQRNYKGPFKFTGGRRGLIADKAPNITSDSTPLEVFLLFFEVVISLLVQETNRYHLQFLAKQDEGPSPQIDVTFSVMMTFLAIVIQMGHDIRDSLKDYWSRLEQFYTPFFGNTMPRDRFFHILRFLHFTDNENSPNRDDANYDRLWKIRSLFNIINDNFAKFYRPSEHLAVDEIIVLFKGRVVFKQYIPKKHKRFGIKIYKICDSYGYTLDMTVYLGKDRLKATKYITATHATVKYLTRRLTRSGHKLMMDNFFCSPDLFDDLKKSKINCCGTVRPNRSGMPKEFQNKKLKLKRGDIKLLLGGIDVIYGIIMAPKSPTPIARQVQSVPDTPDPVVP